MSCLARINVHKRGINGTDLEGATFTLYVDNAVVGEFDAQTDTDTGESARPTPTATCLVRRTRARQLHRRRDDDTERVRHRGSAGGRDRHRRRGPNGDPNEGDTDSLTFDDDVVNGTVQITKTSDAGGLLNGATFTLYPDLDPTGGSLDAGA